MDLLEQLFSILKVFFSDTTFVSFAIILVAILANAVIRLTERKPMRPISALERIANMAGASIEANQPLHVSIGSTTVGDNTTMLALLGSEFIYYAAREVAIGDTPPLFTVSEGASVPLAVDTVRRAYEQENRIHAFNTSNIFRSTLISARWYPAGRRSLAFASALMIMQADDKVSGNILLGRYGSELALILDAAYRNKRPSIAGSDDLDGLAIAYGMADDVLLGEEILTASAYVDDGLRLQKRNFAIDLLRGLVVAAIISFAIYNYFLGG